MPYRFILLAIIITSIICCSPRRSTPEEIYNRFHDRFEQQEALVTDPVDQVYCIAMPNRLNYIKSYLSSLGLSCKFFHAIAPTDLSVADYKFMSATFDKNSPLFRRPTKLAVSLSFYMCYYDAYVHGYDSIMILEDDIVLSQGVNMKQVRHTIREFKDTNYSIMFLGYCLTNCKKIYVDENKIDGTRLYRVPPRTHIFCNHALVMKRTFIKEYAKRVHLYWTENNDNTLLRYINDHRVAACVPDKLLVDQRIDMGSNNQNNPVKALCL